jgi:Na+-driven multidrug efflux pump
VIGPCIGALDIKNAKIYQRTLQTLGITIGIIIGVFYFIFGEYLAEFYTNIDVLVEEAAHVLKLMALFY